MHDLKSQIQSKLHHPMPVTVLETVDSTNRYLKETLEQSECTQQAVLAKTQTAGCGRSGKSFFSPADKGLYLSLFCPMKSYEDTVALTVKTSVAAAVAIETVCKKQVQIKWVNDVFVNEKKICGILTEAVSGFESGVVECVVVGIGINVTDPGFPDELKQVAGSLSGQCRDFSRNRLAALVANHLLELSAALPDRSFLDEYRKRSILLGKPIRFLENNVWYDAVAVDVDNSGGLVIETATGRRTLTSGEVSVRPRD